MKHVKTKMLGLLAVVLLVAVGGCYKTIECWDTAECYLVYKDSDSIFMCGNYINFPETYEPVKKLIQDSGYHAVLLSDTAIKAKIKLRLLEVRVFKLNYRNYCK